MELIGPLFQEQPQGSLMDFEITPLETTTRLAKYYVLSGAKSLVNFVKAGLFLASRLAAQ
jgi:hypothetical protein